MSPSMRSFGRSPARDVQIGRAALDHFLEQHAKVESGGAGRSRSGHRISGVRR